ncbi:MAG: hypothetical protein U0169_20580 [Polyangiaceae bacterium]
MAWDSEPSQKIYRYVDKSGHTVFVNGLALVPKEYQAKAVPVDLSKVDLNETLGNELRARTDESLRAKDAGAKDGGSKGNDRASAEAELRAEGVVVPESPVGMLDPRCLRNLLSGPATPTTPMEFARTNPHVPAILGFIVALLVASPFVARKMGTELTVKVLTRAIPVLLLCLALTHGAIAAQRGARDLKGILRGVPSQCASEGGP